MELLAAAMYAKFDIHVGVLRYRGNQYILTVGATHLPLLRAIVLPHMHPSYLYRLGPVNFPFASQVTVVLVFHI